MLLLIIVVAGLAFVTVATVRALNDARDRYNHDALIANRLIEMRNESHLIFEEYLTRELAGGTGVPWEILTRMQAVSADVQETARHEQETDAQSPAAAAARATLAKYDAAFDVAKAYLRDGSGQNLPRDASDSLRNETVEAFFRALSSWTEVGQARAEISLAAQDDRIRSLLWWLAILMAVLLAGALLVYRSFGRVRSHLAHGFAATAAEQSALHRVATAAAEYDDPEQVFQTIAREVVALLGADAGWLDHITGDRGVTVAQFAVEGTPIAHATASRTRVHPDSVRGVAMRTLAPARVADYLTMPDVIPRDLMEAGVRTAVAAPVVVDGRPWGVIVAVASTPEQLPEGCEQRLTPFARLAGVAIGNAEARRLLAERASTDPLTLLANHGAFQQRLAEEVARARDTGGALGLVVMDIDHFKSVNDTYGHPVGDRVLADVARRLRDLVRDGELLARTGGEEFAWVLPGTDRLGATAAGERAREAVRGTPFGGVGVITLSAGAGGLEMAGDAHDLLAKADQALLRAKAEGRDRTVMYDTRTRQSGAAGRPGRFEQARALEALHALARAVDARHPATVDHAERVAATATAVARRRGWEPPAIESLGDAALLHDVGRVGAPAADGAGSTTHAVLGAQLLADVLTPEQAAWVAGHAQPPSAPDARGDRVYEGTHILAAANVWDGLLHGDGRRPPLRPTVARQTLREMAGERLDANVVEALLDDATPPPAAEEETGGRIRALGNRGLVDGSAGGR